MSDKEKRKTKRTKATVKKEFGKGLDVGTAFIYCAEREKGNIVFRSQRDAFFDIEPGDYTKKMLNKTGVKYIEKDESLYVIGDEAMEMANIFHRELRRPLRKGVISPSEKESLPMIELIIQSVIGRPKCKEEIIYYSVPAAPLDADYNIIYHENIVKRFLEKAGYTPKPINEGMGIIFSELADEEFTGIGISFGAGMVNMCLSYISVPVVTFSLTKSGDWIDEQVGIALGETASRVCEVKEKSLDLTDVKIQSRIETALTIYYDNLIDYVLKSIKQEFDNNPKMPRLTKPVTLVISGGTTMPKGFLVKFNKALSQVKFPMEIGKVKMASSPLYAVAKGALVAAITDEERLEGGTRALV